MAKATTPSAKATAAAPSAPSARRRSIVVATPTIGKIKVKGIDVQFRLDGPRTGHVIMLSNSLMSNFSMWDPTVPALADRYRVLRYDTRGHGRSGTTPGPYTIAQLADDAVGLLDALRIRKAHFVGLSLGGMIGQQLGARYQDRLYSLSLCDTACDMPPRRMWDERIALAKTKGPRGMVDATIKRWFTEPFIKANPQTIAQVRQMILGTGVEGYAGCASAIRDMAQSTLLLGIKTPTLILTGDMDGATTVAQAQVLNRLIDKSKLVIVKDAAHLSNIEKPAAFNRAVRRFIDRVETTLK